MWVLLALAAAFFQVLRNTAMKRLGHALDEYINVWGRFTFLLPFALAMALIKGFPTIKPGFLWACLAPRYWKEFLALGLFAALTTVSQGIAYTLTLSSYVETVKQVEMLFAMGIGVLVFGERQKVREIAPGAVIMLAGMVLLSLAG